MPQGCRCLSAAGYRGICCSHSYWQETSFKSSADSTFRITGSGVLLVPECGAGYRETTVPMLTDKKPASNPVLTTGSPVTEVYRL